jgi:hypothetical protein
MMEKIPKTISAIPNLRIMPAITFLPPFLKPGTNISRNSPHLFIFASLICGLVAGPSLG